MCRETGGRSALRGAGRAWRRGRRHTRRVTDRRPEPTRRRGRLSHQRRPGDHRHPRLLPTARRRPADLRRDRRLERALRRLRDGRPGAVRAIDRGDSPRTSRPTSLPGSSGRLVQVREAGGILAGGTPSATPSPSTGSRSSASPPGPPPPERRRTAGRPTPPDEAARDGLPRFRFASPQDEPDPRYGGRPDARTQPCRR